MTLKYEANGKNTYPDILPGILGPVACGPALEIESNTRERELPYCRRRVSNDGSTIRDDYSMSHPSISYLAHGQVFVSREHPLFHYTSFANFRNILDSGELWASHFSHLNDSNDTRFAFDVFLNIFSNVSRSDDLTNKIFQNRDLFLDNEMFIFSASHNGNLLSQWRSYAGKGGVSIGFPIEIFEVAAKTEPDIKIGKVVYSPKRHQELLAPVAENLLSKLSSEDAIYTVREKIRDHAMDSYRIISPFIKQEGFSEENEFRVVIIKSSFHQRELASETAPRRFTAMPWRKLFYGTDLDLELHHVVAAPSSSPMSDIHKIDYELSQREIRFGSIFHSMISFRFN